MISLLFHAQLEIVKGHLSPTYVTFDPEHNYSFSLTSLLVPSHYNSVVVIDSAFLPLFFSPLWMSLLWLYYYERLFSTPAPIGFPL